MAGLAKSSQERALLKSSSFQIEVSNVLEQQTIPLMLSELICKMTTPRNTTLCHFWARCTAPRERPMPWQEPRFLFAFYLVTPDQMQRNTSLFREPQVPFAFGAKKHADSMRAWAWFYKHLAVYSYERNPDSVKMHRGTYSWERTQKHAQRGLNNLLSIMLAYKL